MPFSVFIPCKYLSADFVISNAKFFHFSRKATSGLGLGYVPQNFAKDALAAGDVFTIQLKEEIPTRHVVLVQDGGRVPNAAAREFARMLNSSVTQQNAP